LDQTSLLEDKCFKLCVMKVDDRYIKTVLNICKNLRWLVNPAAESDQP